MSLCTEGQKLILRMSITSADVRLSADNLLIGQTEASMAREGFVRHINRCVVCSPKPYSASDNRFYLEEEAS